MVYVENLDCQYFFMILLWSANISKNSFRNTMSTSLGPDQDRHSVSPDLGPNCLKRLSAND